MTKLNFADPEFYSFGRIRLPASDLHAILEIFKAKPGASITRERDVGYTHVDFYRLPFALPEFPMVGRVGRIEFADDRFVVLTRYLPLDGSNFEHSLSEALSCFRASEARSRTISFYWDEKPATGLGISSGQFRHGLGTREHNGMTIAPRGHTDDIEAKKRDWLQTLQLTGSGQWIRVADTKSSFTFQPTHPEITFHISGSAPIENQPERLPTQLWISGFPSVDDCAEILRTANRNGLTGTGKLRYSASLDWPVSESIVDAVNDVASCWDISYTADYPKDPFELPENLPPGDYRCPVVLFEHRTKLSAYPQIDVLHLKSGEVCLEFTTVGGPKHLKKLAKEVDCEIEIWKGPPEDRWGDG